MRHSATTRRVSKISSVTIGLQGFNLVLTGGGVRSLDVPMSRVLMVIVIKCSRARGRDMAQLFTAEPEIRNQSRAQFPTDTDTMTVNILKFPTQTPLHLRAPPPPPPHTPCLFESRCYWVQDVKPLTPIRLIKESVTVKLAARAETAGCVG
ncbi:hypothetical protein BaRGS_00040129 [Batillaria attramentaria]|uniref:Uncharacterized protein n=1 Tax=Batillaria attramentaria TaxID=370345 RepID=A0ABD0J1I0_9CAEN